MSAAFFLVNGAWLSAASIVRCRLSTTTKSSRAKSAIANLRAQHTPYTLVLGEEPDTATRRWMAERFPEATVIALPNSGHFPHVAHPDAFARILASVSS